MQKVRWGILSTAKIGTLKVIPAMQLGRHSAVVAIGSRSAAVAEQAAATLGIARSYGSYEALLADPQVEAVYNPLPNHLHVPWSIKALEAGKYVLCEKPIGLTAAEGQLLVDAGRRHPQLKLVRSRCFTPPLFLTHQQRRSVKPGCRFPHNICACLGRQKYTL